MKNVWTEERIYKWFLHRVAMSGTLERDLKKETRDKMYQAFRKGFIESLKKNSKNDLSQLEGINE